MLHTSVFDRVGRFNPTFRYGQDWEMWRRIGEQYLWQWSPEVLGTRRETFDNLTARISRDGATRRQRDAENELIRAMY